ncbi:RNA 2',3'-cyclic phosphodiesterase [Klebsiella pneumoniae subsp. pneumoniae]|nr:RNA 2',3'-cyclic phosphodiesterase [Klebsiella pneumoniae subsp. pneumoniae]
MVQWRATHFPEDAGRPVAADNLHLTLAFLGEVSAEKQRALAALAGRLRQPGFTLTLDDAGRWLRSRVVWLRNPPAAARPAAARQHVARSGGAQRRCYQSPQPFHPAYYPVARCSPGGADPGPRLSLDISGERVSCSMESSFSRGRTRYTALERYPFDKES